MARPKVEKSQKRLARCVSMHESTRELARMIGYGSISKGLEIAVHEHAKRCGVEIAQGATDAD